MDGVVNTRSPGAQSGGYRVGNPCFWCRTGGWTSFIFLQRRSLLVVLLSSVAFLNLPHSAGQAKQDTSWEFVAKKRGVAVYKREVPGQAVPTVRAVATLNAPLDHIHKVIFDPNQYPAWNPDCTKAKLLKRLSDDQIIFYFLNDVPWPASDRDAVTRLQVIESSRDSRGYRIRISKHEDSLFPTQPGIERVPILEGYYDLRSLDAKTTQLEYVITTDTGGYLPGPLVSFFTVRSPVNLIAGLEAELQRRKQHSPSGTKPQDASPSAPAQH